MALALCMLKICYRDQYASSPCIPFDIVSETTPSAVVATRQVDIDHPGCYTLSLTGQSASLLKSPPPTCTTLAQSAHLTQLEMTFASHTAPTTPNKTAMTSATNLADTSRRCQVRSRPVTSSSTAAPRHDELAVHPVLVVVATVVAAVAVAVHTLHAGSGDEAVMAALDRPLSLTTTMHDDAPRCSSPTLAKSANERDRRDASHIGAGRVDGFLAGQRDGDALVATYDEIDDVVTTFRCVERSATPRMSPTKHDGVHDLEPPEACARVPCGGTYACKDFRALIQDVDDALERPPDRRRHACDYDAPVHCKAFFHAGFIYDLYVPPEARGRPRRRSSGGILTLRMKVLFAGGCLYDLYVPPEVLEKCALLDAG
ncbi:hypothetical protein BD626DRAFT_577554 [Schizophyllum amplum]|uniref:Uncharacterized protein n=1 Tax=Schizophyllum amplum TaxID=97359 RepID=A0A550BSD9_9AGAR|nr:hypothetical protein BD626DRAFT_577554 [Auriculariopsis ampla]